MKNRRPLLLYREISRAGPEGAYKKTVFRYKCVTFTCGRVCGGARVLWLRILSVVS